MLFRPSLENILNILSGLQWSQIYLTWNIVICNLKPAYYEISERLWRFTDCSDIFNANLNEPTIYLELTFINLIMNFSGIWVSENDENKPTFFLFKLTSNAQIFIFLV